MFSGCSDGSYWPGGIWWSFQMKVWTLKIQRNPMIPNYSMIPAAAIRWSPGIWWSPAIRWSIRSMDFDNRKVYGDTSITDGLVNLILTNLPASHPVVLRNLFPSQLEFSNHTEKKLQSTPVTLKKASLDKGRGSNNLPPNSKKRCIFRC